MNLKIYLLCNTGKKPPFVTQATAHKEKAEHWKELLEFQGEDITMIELAYYPLECIQEMLEATPTA